ncbi:MAG TPA: hypothetical protein VF516_24685, partial [Kofleriaceae bacterium]
VRVEPDLTLSEPIEYPALFLKRGEDKRLREGHLWVFSNEVDVARSPRSSALDICQRVYQQRINVSPGAIGGAPGTASP